MNHGWNPSAYYYVCISHSVMSDSETPQTVAHQPPLSKGFTRQEYWSGLPLLLDRILILKHSSGNVN